MMNAKRACNVMVEGKTVRMLNTQTRYRKRSGRWSRTPEVWFRSPGMNCWLKDCLLKEWDKGMFGCNFEVVQ